MTPRESDPTRGNAGQDYGERTSAAERGGAADVPARTGSDSPGIDIGAPKDSALGGHVSPSTAIRGLLDARSIASSAAAFHRRLSNELLYGKAPFKNVNEAKTPEADEANIPLADAISVARELNTQALELFDHREQMANDGLAAMAPHYDTAVAETPEPSRKVTRMNELIEAGAADEGARPHPDVLFAEQSEQQFSEDLRRLPEEPQFGEALQRIRAARGGEPVPVGEVFPRVINDLERRQAEAQATGELSEEDRITLFLTMRPNATLDEIKEGAGVTTKGGAFDSLITSRTLISSGRREVPGRPSPTEWRLAREVSVADQVQAALMLRGPASIADITERTGLTSPADIANALGELHERGIAGNVTPGDMPLYGLYSRQEREALEVSQAEEQLPESDPMSIDNFYLKPHEKKVIALLRGGPRMPEEIGDAAATPGYKHVHPSDVRGESIIARLGWRLDAIQTTEQIIQLPDGSYDLVRRGSETAEPPAEEKTQTEE